MRVQKKDCDPTSKPQTKKKGKPIFRHRKNLHPSDIRVVVVNAAHNDGDAFPTPLIKNRKVNRSEAKKGYVPAQETRRRGAKATSLKCTLKTGGVGEGGGAGTCLLALGASG